MNILNETLDMILRNMNLRNISFEDDSNLITLKHQSQSKFNIVNLTIDLVKSGGIEFSPEAIDNIE